MKKSEVIKQLTVTKEFSTNKKVKEIMENTIEFLNKQKINSLSRK